MFEAQQQKASIKLDEVQLRDELRSLRRLIPDSPWLNPITAVAFDLSRKLEAGDISFEELKALAGRLLDNACVERARRMRSRVEFVDQNATINDFSSFIQSTIDSSGSDADALSKFANRWERARSGIVLTAHPTFGLSDGLSRRMIEIAVDNDESAASVIGHRHRPDDGIDLDYEHSRAQDAIINLRNAYEELLNSFYSVAAARFGDDAFSLRPKLTTIATWVGYDLDGRTDITWIRSFVLKLEEKKAALTDIRERFLTLKHHLGDESEIERLARQMTGKLDLAIAAVTEQYKALKAVAEEDKPLAEGANVVTRPDGYNITSVSTLTQILDDLVSTVSSPQMKRSLAALRGLIEATGLGTAHIHVRINAAQLDNALRAFVHEPWTADLSERRALEQLAKMIDETEEESVNFGTLDLETATAIRQFALIAQIHKYVDADTPIRFLIAECESPASVMIAVLFAKLFGVSDAVDISPLFETPSGLERGGRLIGELLSQKSYRDYVSRRRRLSIQAGFSDAGRFIGQAAATMAIERLHHSIAKQIHKAELGDVETLIFSTHGESMGRGAHPGDLRRRLSYVLPHESRRRFEKYGLPIKHETSFQGGDGYLFFANRRLTTRALATVIMDGGYLERDPDPYYDDENLSLDIFLRLRAYQQNLFAHSGYRALLGAFGPNLLFKTGSRAVKRQSDTAAPVDRGDPSRMRAIPNNAILQQFGYVANVVAGLGAAAGSDRERFVALAKKSQRLRTIIEMIARAKQLSSLNAMSANAQIFDAGFWASRASWGCEPKLDKAFRLLSTTLLKDDRASDIHGLTHHLRLDAIDLHAILEEIGLEGGKVPDDIRLELDLLQAIRLALIMRIFILCARLPRFAPRNDMSPDQILKMALSLDIPEVLSFMRMAFPRRAGAELQSDAFTESATYRPHGIEDYGRLETEILAPMEEAYEFIREIGTGISHHFGAFG